MGLLLILILIFDLNLLSDVLYWLCISWGVVACKMWRVCFENHMDDPIEFFSSSIKCMASCKSWTKSFVTQ